MFFHAMHSLLQMFHACKVCTPFSEIVHGWKAFPNIENRVTRKVKALQRASGSVCPQRTPHLSLETACMRHVPPLLPALSPHLCVTSCAPGNPEWGQRQHGLARQPISDQPWALFPRPREMGRCARWRSFPMSAASLRRCNAVGSSARAWEVFAPLPGPRPCPFERVATRRHTPRK